MTPRSVAVVGAGWAGLAAALRACEAGHRVTIFEMAPRPGGRARSEPEAGHADSPFDNGQHILVGAYTRTLALMRCAGVDPEQVLLRRPLELRFADGRVLACRGGAAVPAFVAAVLRCNAWRWRDKLALLRACARWQLQGFRCDPALTVATLVAELPASVRQLLIDPLCVAALNTPSREASAEVFLRVLHDALFAGRGGSDLLLPRRSLHELLPGPALATLAAAGAEIRLRQRAMTLEAAAGGWALDAEPFDRVVLACTANEAARLAGTVSAEWAALASALRYEPIITVCTQQRGSATLDAPMWALHEDETSPAQFVFDHGQLGGPPGRLAFVISGAARWVAAGMPATTAAVLQQAGRQLPRSAWRSDQASVLALRCEHRATFRCTPGLTRPPQRIAAGLFAAGDYVAGPYPSTLEGAVRCGEEAARALSD